MHLLFLHTNTEKMSQLETSKKKKKKSQKAKDIIAQRYGKEGTKEREQFREKANDGQMVEYEFIFNAKQIIIIMSITELNFNHLNCKIG